MKAASYQPFPMAGAARGQVWRYSPAYRRPRHFHAEPELNVVTAGTATFGVGEGEIAASAGDLLWWLPGQDHELLAASHDLDLFVIGLTPALSARALGPMGAATYGGPLRIRMPPAEARAIFAGCFGLSAVTDGAMDGVAVESRVGDLWRQAHALRLPHRGMHALTRRAVRSMLERRDVDRVDVAPPGADLGDVSRHFRRNVKLTFTSYRSRLRLLRFIEEADRNPSLLAAALAAGFGSYSQCHRSFQSVLGCTPRDFFAGVGRDAMIDAFEPFASPPSEPLGLRQTAAGE